MKVCGYCGKEYDEVKTKCPVCGSTLLKYNKHSDPAEAELKRIKDEIERKRKSRSLIIGIGAAVIILAIVIAIFSITSYVTDPQRDIAKESKELFVQAEQQIDNKDYDAAIDTLDQINPEWDDYADAEALRVEAVRSQLTTKVAEYQAVGNYQGIITFIKENVADINSDSEIKAAYNSAVQQYVSAVLAEADEHLSTANYNSARTVLNTAVALVGEDVNITAKLAEIENAEILATIKTHEDNSDYISLVSYLQGIVAYDSSYVALLDQYTQILVDTTLNTAQTYADNRQFTEAIQVITQTQQVYDCPELQEASVTYGSCLPIRLVDCYVVEDSLSESNSTIGDVEDCFGKKHENSLQIEWLAFDEEYVIYNLDKRFVSLSGTFVAGNGNGSKATCVMSVYLDGNLVYQSPEMTNTTQAVTININVSDASLMKIAFENTTYNITADFSREGFCLIDATLS